MSKHTPGPWSVVNHNNEEMSLDVVSDDRPYICTVWDGALPKVTEANARLIASAPDMKELLEHPLLQRMLGDIEDLQTEETAHIWALAVQWMELRDRLIATATGEYS